jgi:hypothetical protein
MKKHNIQYFEIADKLCCFSVVLKYGSLSLPLKNILELENELMGSANIRDAISTQSVPTPELGNFD